MYGESLSRPSGAPSRAPAKTATNDVPWQFRETEETSIYARRVPVPSVSALAVAEKRVSALRELPRDSVGCKVGG